jgi:hypothetical protein
MTAQLYDFDQLAVLLDEFYPRLISQIDRDPDSPTYGSVDRGFWMYRLHDFDSGVLMQTSLTLAALYQLAGLGKLANLPNLSQVPPEYFKYLAEAVNRRNLMLIGKNGTVDEYYPGEQSFVATAFAGYATLKSAILLGQSEVLQSKEMESAARYYLRRHPAHPANQESAAAAFLALYSHHLSWRKDEVQKVVTRLIAREADHGEFLEYGGGDLGYASVALNYLGYMVQDGSFPVADQFRKLADDLAVFVTPSGRLGGEFAARSTTYFLPFGFLQAAYLDADIGGQFALLDFDSMYRKLDDRYLFHYSLPALAMTALKLVQTGTPKLNPAPEIRKWQAQNRFGGCLFAARKADQAVYIGLNKGAAYQVEQGAQSTIECGYRINRDGKVYATCVVGDVEDVQIQEEDKKIELEIQVPFKRYGLLTASPVKTIALRVISFLGPKLAKLFKDILIKAPQTLNNVHLHRKFTLDTNTSTLQVEDKIMGLEKEDFLSLAPPASFRLVPSAKFYMPGEEEAYLAAQEPLSGDSFTRNFSLK